MRPLFEDIRASSHYKDNAVTPKKEKLAKPLPLLFA